MNLVPELATYPSGEWALKAHMYLPEGNGPFPAVVINHGSGLEQTAKAGVAEILLRHGYLVFVPYRRGYAGSPGPSRLDEVRVEPVHPDYSEAVRVRLLKENDDVLAALRYVRNLPEVDPNRTAVMGSSYGGINSLLAGGRDPKLRAVVSFAAAAMTWKPAPTVARMLLEHVAKTAAPVLLLQAENDFDLTPGRSLAAELARLGKPHRFHVFPPFGGDEMEAHQIWVNAPQLWEPVVIPFLDNALARERAMDK